MNFVFVVLISLFSLSASAAQNNIILSSFKEGHLSIGAEATYLTTSANYTERSTSLDFNSEYGFSSFQSLLYGRYDFSNQVSIFSDLALNYAMSENVTDTYAAFKVAGINIGANYNLKFKFLKIVPQLRGYYAVEKFDRSSDEVLSSDGASYFEIGSHLFKDFAAFQLHTYLSYQYRTDGFSGLLNYQADLGYRFRSILILLGLKGFHSVTEDKYSSNPSFRHSYLDTVNGSSLMYGAVDPSRIDLFTQANFSLNNSIDFYIAANKSIRGTRTGDFLSITTGLEYFFEPITKKRNHFRTVPPDDFRYNDETIDPIIENKIKSFNKPKKKIRRKRRLPRSRRSTQKKQTDNGPVTSEKYIGKKTTSTSPIKQKSKKPKRVNIEF